ncbi:hypothetical protein FJZ19_01470 [Candidatus Pacearchaeota archaeon]|nr:hypothetical protein [Candidatus Pacearchaeota archaeon]
MKRGKARKFIYILIFLVLIILPAFVYAQEQNNKNIFGKIGDFFQNILSKLRITGNVVETMSFPTDENWPSEKYLSAQPATVSFTVPSDYQGKFVDVGVIVSASQYGYTQCSYDVSLSVSGCSKSGSGATCTITPSLGSTVTLNVAPVEPMGSCSGTGGWGSMHVKVYRYPYCGDGDCNSQSRDLSNVNGQLARETCTNCPDDCLDSGEICCSGAVIIGGECCINSDCSYGETCSVYNKCVAAAKKSNGESCTSGSQCNSGYCNRYCCQYPNPCCASNSDCNTDYECGSDKYCVRRTVNNKANGQTCVYNTECNSGWCHKGVCCEYGKTCCLYNSECTSGVCSNYYCQSFQQTTKYSNGHSCYSDSDCDSENCENDICCSYGKTCCAYDYECSSGYHCSSSYYCVKSTTESETKSAGETCYSDSECSSGNCEAGICCYSSEICCYSDYECDSEYKCENYKCVLKSFTTSKADGEYCSSSSDCTSGWCDNSICCEYGKECCVNDNQCDSGVCWAAQGTDDYWCKEATTQETAAKKSNGESCGYGSDCESDRCSNSICCSQAVYSCCSSDSQCGYGRECANKICTEKAPKTQAEQTQKKSDTESKFLNSFYKYYGITGYYSPVLKKTVPKSDYYAGVSILFQEQASQIDTKVMAFGKFTTVLNTIKGMTMSAASVDPIGLAISIGDFMDEMSTEVGVEQGENIAANLYSTASLAFSAAGESERASAGLAKLTSRFPSNRVIKSISARQQALQNKMLPDKTAQSQMVLLSLADFAMEKTLMADVKEAGRYGTVDYLQKIELSIMAKELSKLYKKAEKNKITEDEAALLMSYEQEFWLLEIARNKNYIAYEENAGFLSKGFYAITKTILSANYEDNIKSANDIIEDAQKKYTAAAAGKTEVYANI